MDLLRTNTFKVVGRLTSVDMKTGNRKSDGAGFIIGTATVVSNIGGRDNEFIVRFSSSEHTVDGKPNKLYTSYAHLDELKGKKVQIDGDIRENRFFSTKTNQMTGGNQLNGKFVKGVTESSQDEAVFELGGFVVEELKERANKNNEVYRYDLTLGQSNYSGNMMSKFVVHVDPNDREIINGVKNYHIGDTVRVNGNLNFIVNIVTSTAKNEGGFGEGLTKTFTNRINNFFIQGGTAAITDDAQGHYPADIIKNLVSAYKAKDVELTNKAKESGDASVVEEEPAITQRQTSLI